MGRGQKAPQGRLSSSTCEGPKNIKTALSQNIWKLFIFTNFLKDVSLPMDGRSFTSVYQRLLTNGTDGCAGQRKLRGSFARKEPGGMDRPIFSNILSQTNNPLISKKIIMWWQTRRISCFWQNSSPQESARGCPLCHRVGGSCHLVSPCHSVTLPPCHSSQSPCQLFNLPKGALDCYEC